MKTLAIDSARMVSVDGKKLGRLGRQNAAALNLLIANRHTLTTWQNLAAVSGTVAENAERRVHVMICTLRRLLGRDMIERVSKGGYRLAENVLVETGVGAAAGFWVPIGADLAADLEARAAERQQSAPGLAADIIRAWLTRAPE